jgi:hypothetical protein
MSLISKLLHFVIITSQKYGIDDWMGWYIYQDYLYGRGADPKVKGVIFDVIQDTVLDYFKKDGVKPPNYVLLYAPLEELKRNVIARSKTDARGSWVFSEQFLRKFIAKEEKEAAKKAKAEAKPAAKKEEAKK